MVKSKKKSKAELKAEQEAQEKEFIYKVMDMATKVPKEVYFSFILAIAWGKTHEGSMNGNDLLLGAVGGFTLGPALQGEIGANAYALSYLGALGFNFVDQDVKDWLEKNGPFDYIGDGIAGTLQNMGVFPDTEIPGPYDYIGDTIGMILGLDKEP